MNFKAFALALAMIGAASAQSVTWLSPTPGTTIRAGESLTATVRFADTTSSVNVLALAFGLRASNDPQTTDLGQTHLGTVTHPTFVTGKEGAFVNSTTFTIPASLITGLDQNYTLAVAEFFLLGAENTASVFTDNVEVFVSS